MVKRYGIGYRPFENSPSMVGDKEGDYVQIEDYDALSLQLVNRTAELVAVQGRLADMQVSLAAVEAECADLIAGKEYQAMQRTLGEVNDKFVKVWEKLAEAVALLERWHNEYHSHWYFEGIDDDTTTFIGLAARAGEVKP